MKIFKCFQQAHFAHLKVKYCFRSKLYQSAQPLHNIDIANDVINTHIIIQKCTIHQLKLYYSKYLLRVKLLLNKSLMIS